MSRLPRVTGVEVIRALQRDGFHLVRTRGSHHYLRKPGRQSLVVVPVHMGRELPEGTLGSILRQAGLSVDEFIALLKS